MIKEPLNPCQWGNNDTFCQQQQRRRGHVLRVKVAPTMVLGVELVDGGHKIVPFEKGDATST